MALDGFLAGHPTHPIAVQPCAINEKVGPELSRSCLGDPARMQFGNASVQDDMSSCVTNLSCERLANARKIHNSFLWNPYCGNARYMGFDLAHGLPVKPG